MFICINVLYVIIYSLLTVINIIPVTFNYINFEYFNIITFQTIFVNCNRNIFFFIVGISFFDFSIIATVRNYYILPSNNNRTTSITKLVEDVIFNKL